MFAITSFYTGLVLIIFLVLSVRVILYRRDKSISLGDQGDPYMLRRMRAQANCAEYAPMGLIALALIEAQGASALLVHALGAMLVLGRGLHGAALSGKYWGFGRIVGTALTLTMLIISVVSLIGLSVVS
ncbi:MAG: MAPEG family protein [Pseudomonadota bacterium]